MQNNKLEFIYPNSKNLYPKLRIYNPKFEEFISQILRIYISIIIMDTFKVSNV